MTAPSGYRHSLPLLAAFLLAFLIPFPFLFGSIGVISVVITAFLLRGKTVFRNFRERKLLWAPVALYLWYLASWLWSTDKAEAGAILSTKLPLLLLPVALGSSGYFRKETLRKTLTFFSLGVAIIGIYCGWNAWSRFQTDGDLGGLFYHRLVTGLDASAVYMAWYVVVAILFLLLDWGKQNKNRNLLLPATGTLLLLILLPFFLMLAARTLLLSFLFLALPVILYQSFRKETVFSQKLRIWVFTVAMLSATIYAFQQPAIQSRFHDLQKSKPELSFLKHYKGEENSFGDMNIRLFLWRIGVQNIGSSPGMLLLGCGVGDAHEKINQTVRELGIPNMEQDSPNRSPYYGINLHNTYLHTALATGIPGLLLLLFTVGSLFVEGLRQFRPFSFIFIFSLFSLIFMMQEAILETQAGAIFYVFMYSILMDYVYSSRASNRAVNPTKSES